MKTQDIFSYIIGQFKNERSCFMLLSGIILLILTLVKKHADIEPENVALMVDCIFYTKLIFFISIFTTFMPTHRDIFRYKKDKIKNDLFNEENVNAGIERIDSIAKKLEQKYLTEKK